MDDQQIFSFNGVFYKREFVGQTSGPKVAECEISGNSVKDILDEVWNEARNHVNREILISPSNESSWSETVSPSREDIGKFVSFQEPNGRKLTQSNQVTTQWLQKQRDKPVNILIHVYGMTISNKSIWTKVKKVLIDPELRDRAGADANQALVQLADSLKEIHGNSLTALDGVWRLWANAIQSAPAHSRENLMQELPPVHLIQMFRRVPIGEAEVLRNTTNGLNVARNVNSALRDDIVALQTAFANFRRDIVREFDLFGLRLENLARVASNQDSLIDSMRQSIQPQENEISMQESAEVDDMEDIDHA